MHQPDYRLPGEGGKAAMPWVRLHAAKDYMDMARLAEAAPENLRVTLNVTPCLLEQLEDLAQGRHSDAFLEIARKDAKDLTEPERLYALEHFFSVNEEQMLRPLPRYVELRDRRSRARASGKLLESFSDDDLRDLVVLFHLAWSGQWLRRDAAVQHLIAKGRAFREDEKKSLLALQDEQARAIAPLYGALARAGKIEISTTPLYHPILPLLIDLNAASESRPGCSTGGNEFRWPEDAKAQIELGLDRVEDRLGFRPEGMWPSEGSLSAATLSLLSEAQVRWCATDEQNLRKSLGPGDRDGVPHLRPWNLGGEGPSIFFRDTQLSDVIGFTYARWEANRAAEDFIARTLAVGRDYHGPGEPIIPVILDGENAWEFYVANGEPFLTALYKRLASTPGLEATTFSRALEHAKPGKLARFAPGSWIHGDFDTWAGHPEKNRAWQLLSEVRRQVADASRERPIADDVREVLFRAEGSDWFWWLGDDHPTAYLSEFDALFRQNLAFVCQRTETRPPVGLDEPIARREKKVAIEPPFSLITPKIDGVAERYYEWLGAGIYRAGEEGGAMRLGTEKLARELRFGFDDENLYLRVSPRPKGEPALKAASVRLSFDGGLAGPPDPKLAASHPRILDWSQARGLRTLSGEPLPGAEGACEKVLELSIPRKAVRLEKGGSARLVVEITAHDGSRERIPLDGSIELTGPDEHFDLRHWTL
jgi:alpha-amylase/alpha-mannosidase (GH57 family)